jgi:hypothetical protein
LFWKHKKGGTMFFGRKIAEVTEVVKSGFPRPPANVDVRTSKPPEVTEVVKSGFPRPPANVDVRTSKPPEVTEVVKSGFPRPPANVDVRTSKPPVEIPVYGDQAAGLTQFGTTWLCLDDIQVVEFGPPDGCGAEIQFRGTSGENEWHMPVADGLALRAYLEGMNQAKEAVDKG